MKIKKEKKIKNLNVRLTEKQKSIIEDYCKKNDLKQSIFFRNCLLKYLKF